VQKQSPAHRVEGYEVTNTVTVTVTVTEEEEDTHRPGCIVGPNKCSVLWRPGSAGSCIMHCCNSSAGLCDSTTSFTFIMQCATPFQWQQHAGASHEACLEGSTHRYTPVHGRHWREGVDT